MSLTIRSTSRTGQCKLTVYMKNGLETTKTIYCPRFEIDRTIANIVSLNGNKCEKVKVYLNNILMN